MFRLARNAPLFAVAFIALSSAIQVACGESDDSDVTEDALYDGIETEDAGATDAARVRCAPVDGVPFSWAPPQRLHQGVCNQQEIDALMGNAGPLGEACIACAYSTVSARSWGAWLYNGAGHLTVNLGGCIAQLTGDFSSRGCGAAVSKRGACKQAACALCGDDDLRSCLDAASASCAEHEAAAACADELLRPGGAAEACATTPDSTADMRRYLSLFCGA